jgi:membrane fusion protein (multidrug efflux system)
MKNDMYRLRVAMSDRQLNVTESPPTSTGTHKETAPPRAATLAGTPESRVVIASEESIRDHAAPPTTGAEAATRTRQRKFPRAIIALAVLGSVLAGALYYWKWVAPYESTDDAFIEANVIPVAPQVSGRVVRLLVNDNQEVRQGDELVQIDPSDYQVKLDQARANLAAAKGRLQQAKALFEVDEARVQQERASVVAAQAESQRADADLKRYQAVGNRGVSQSRLDLAATEARSSSAAADVARNKQLAAESQSTLDKASIETAMADVTRNEAAVHQAELDLSYTHITAPRAGFVTHRAVEAGSYIQTGQPLLAIVPRDVWVIANFKETQLRHMQPGQPVDIRVDAFPNLKIKGHVDSIQAGAGARFSLLPPENASGNYVKVVQRVPVKIAIDEKPDSRHLLGPGMSVVPEVRVR